MIVYTREKVRYLLRLEFVRFCIVGGTGFVINFIILALLPRLLGAPIWLAQLIGAETALFSNFMLHHNWTYRHNRVDKSLISLIIQFHATSWPAILGSTLMVSIAVSLLHMNRFVALAISSAIALMWNFSWSKYVIWRDVGTKEAEEIAA